MSGQFFPIRGTLTPVSMMPAAFIGALLVVSAQAQMGDPMDDMPPMDGDMSSMMGGMDGDMASMM